jgi:hypothetical protein
MIGSYTPNAFERAGNCARQGLKANEHLGLSSSGVSKSDE